MTSLRTLATHHRNCRTVHTLASATGGPPAPAGSGLSLLQASKQLQHKGVGFCKNPTKPVPLRRLPSNNLDLVVELIVAEEPFAACALPTQLEVPQELAPLVALEALHPATIVSRLAQVEAHLAAYGEERRRAVSTCPAFVGFLERSLELVGQRGMGPAAPLLLLRLLSLLRFGDDARLRTAYARFARHLVTYLEDSIKRDSSGLNPQALVGCYEAWAGMDMPVLPPKSSLVAVKLRDRLRGSRFSVQECVALFVAFGQLRRRSRGQFNPCNYDVNDIVSVIVHGVRGIQEDDLAEVVAACAEFDWPIHRSPLKALDSVALEVIRRLAIRELPVDSAERLLRQAVEAASSIRPRLGQELQANIQQWELQALAGAASLTAAEAMASWAEAQEAASALSNVVTFSLTEQAQLAGGPFSAH